MNASRVTIVLALLVLASALSANAGTDDVIVVTRDSQSLPSGCTPRETAELLVRFTDAVSTGDLKALDRLFAIEDPPGKAVELPEPYFRWYSVTEVRSGEAQPWRHVVFYDRDPVLDYFAERQRQNERWELIAVAVGPAGWIPGAAGITYLVRRDADDLPASLTRLAIGKGGIDCAAQRIYVWSMGHHDQNQLIAPCPVPAGWTPGTAIVACSRSEASGERTGPNARAVVPDFRMITGSRRLPPRCRPMFVFGKLRSALSAFNTGRGTAFAKHFVPRALLATEKSIVGRGAIARFARARYEKGDGWTGTALHAPQGNAGLPDHGIYRLDLLLTSPGKPLAPASAKIVFACRSGLILKWAGPAVAAQ